MRVLSAHGGSQARLGRSRDSTALDLPDEFRRGRPPTIGTSLTNPDVSGAPKPLESKPISVTAIETAAEAVADTITAAGDLHADEAYLARRCCDLDRTDVARR